VMLATSGLLELDLGDLQGGMAKVYRALPEAAPILHDLYGGYFAKMQLFSGLGDVATLVADTPKSSSKSMQIVRFAAWLEELEPLKLAIKHCISDSPQDAKTHVMKDHYVAVNALTLLEVLQRPVRKNVLAQIKRVEALPVREPRNRVLIEVVKTQLLRAARLKEEARAQWSRAQAEIEKLSTDITLSPDFAAIHYRNALELAPTQAALANARDFFRAHFQGGYACFKKWAEA